MDKELEDYRNFLAQAEQKSLDAYDKSLLTLSGGALAISIAFIDEIVGTGQLKIQSMLIIAWTSWIATIGGTISSFYISHLALRKVIGQISRNEQLDDPPGGRYTIAIKVLNAINGILFIVGLIFITIFAGVNL